MSENRRTVLAMLGLGSVASIGTDTFLAPPAKAGELRSVSQAYDNERFAAAFEKIAAEIRKGSISVERLAVNSSMEPNALADRHDLELRFFYIPVNA